MIILRHGFLIALLLLPSVVIAHPLTDKDLCELSRKENCNPGQSEKILGHYEGWAEAQGKIGVYEWLCDNQWFSGSTFYRPLEILSGNAYAIDWFLQRAFDERELNPENELLMNLLSATLTGISHKNNNTEINQFLETCFSVNGSTRLAELLFHLLTNDLHWSFVSINYRGLFRAALRSRNYHLITDHLLRSAHIARLSPANQLNDHYRRLILTELIENPALWENGSDVDNGFGLEWDHTVDINPASGEERTEAGTWASEGAGANEDLNQPVRGSFGVLLEWLSSANDRFLLTEMTFRALEHRNMPVFNWLKSLVGESRLQLIENYEYHNQTRAENGSQTQVIDVEPEINHSCWGCFRFSCQ